MKEFLIVCLVVGLPLLFAIIIRHVGKKTLLKDYGRDYDNLVHYVRECPINGANFEFTTRKFDEIWRYKCKDREKLDVLKREFYERFVGFSPKT